MATGITFDTREAAIEYRDNMHTEGYAAEITYDKPTGQYRVSIGTGLKAPPEEEFRITPTEITKEEEEIEAGIAVREGMVCYGAEGKTERSCLIAGGSWVTKAEAKALKAEAKAVAKYTPTRPPTFGEREAERRAKRLGPKGLLAKPPEETPERLIGAAAGEGERILGKISTHISPKRGIRQAVPRTTISSTPTRMPNSIGTNGRRPRIMQIPKAPGAGKMPTPSGIPYLKKPKEDKEEEK